MSKVGRPIGKLHQEDVRRKIQVSQLINVLQDHALTGEGKLEPTRMKAIEIFFLLQRFYESSHKIRRENEEVSVL